MALDQGGGFGMCILAVVSFSAFIFRAGTCVNVQWARGAVLGGHRVLPLLGFMLGLWCT